MFRFFQTLQNIPLNIDKYIHYFFPDTFIPYPNPFFVAIVLLSCPPGAALCFSAVLGPISWILCSPLSWWTPWWGGWGSTYSSSFLRKMLETDTVWVNLNAWKYLYSLPLIVSLTWLKCIAEKYFSLRHFKEFLHGFVVSSVIIGKSFCSLIHLLFLLYPWFSWWYTWVSYCLYPHWLCLKLKRLLLISSHSGKNLHFFSNFWALFLLFFHSEMTLFLSWMLDPLDWSCNYIIFFFLLSFSVVSPLE